MFTTHPPWQSSPQHGTYYEGPTTDEGDYHDVLQHPALTPAGKATRTAEERSNKRSPVPVAETSFGSAARRAEGHTRQRTSSGYEQHAPLHMRAVGTTPQGSGAGPDSDYAGYAASQGQTEARRFQASDDGNNGGGDDHRLEI